MAESSFLGGKFPFVIVNFLCPDGGHLGFFTLGERRDLVFVLFLSLCIYFNSCSVNAATLNDVRVQSPWKLQMATASKINDPFRNAEEHFRRIGRLWKLVQSRRREISETPEEKLRQPAVSGNCHDSEKLRRKIKTNRLPVSTGTVLAAIFYIPF